MITSPKPKKSFINSRKLRKADKLIVLQFYYFNTKIIREYFKYKRLNHKPSLPLLTLTTLKIVNTQPL